MSDFTPNSMETANLTVQDWRNCYELLGIRTIPLIGKSPLDSISWKTTPYEEQWQRVGNKTDINIGIVTGNGLAVIDADNMETANAICAGLISMNLSPISVLTPRGMHFYVRIEGVPDQFNQARLMPGIYKGEFRTQNSYVVAPFSTVNGKTYSWNTGRPEDLKTQSVVQWKDLLWLLPEQSSVSLIEELPIRLLHRDMPEKVKNLLNQLAGAVKGHAVEEYHTRSEAEAAVVAILILAGWSYEEILDTFLKYGPGKFHDSKGKDQQRYFDKTYYRVLSKMASNPIRQKIAATWKIVDTNPHWIGANGYAKRDTYLGLLAICWQFGTWNISASERDLAEYATTTQPSIHKILYKLSKLGIIQKTSEGRLLGSATKWQVTPVEGISSEVMIYDNFPPYEVVEIWSPSKLGRTAGTIYRLLSTKPLSIRYLAQTTGKARSTVKSALEKRLATFKLAVKLPEGWVRGNANLTDVAMKYEAEKAAYKRHSYHKHERERFAAFRANFNNYQKTDQKIEFKTPWEF